MKRFHKILAQIDTSHSMQPVLDAALVIARRFEASLTVVDVVPEFTWPARLTVPKGEELRGMLAEQKRRRLTEIVAPYLNNKGLHITTRVLMGRTSSRLIDEVQTGGHDLVMRLTKGVHSRRTGVLGTTGLQLLRYCPCAVWLVKPEQLPKPTHIVAAVDVGSADEAHRRLNATIVDTAASLAAAEDCSLSILHAWSIYGENVLREHLKPEEFEDLERTTLADHQRAMDELMRSQGVTLGAEHIHLVRGDAGLEIPRFVQQGRVDLLVMGTVARRGAAGWFLGNTAERVFDKVNCSLLAVKPQDAAAT
jgi:nucleotide-binding universal stress UspA family protein